MFIGASIGFFIWVLTLAAAKVQQSDREEYDYPAVYLAGVVFTGMGFFIGGLIS